MGLFNAIKKKAKQWAKKALSGSNDKPKAPKPDAQLGPSGAADAARTAREAAMASRRARRGARGRDSTIITARSDIGSRTLLG